MRFCNKCFECKDVSKFYKDSACIDGLNRRCKACVDAATMVRYKRLKVYVFDANETKEEKRARALKRMRDFRNEKYRKLNPGSKIRVKKTSEEKLEHLRLYHRAYKAKKRKEDPIYKLKANLRTSIANFFSKNKHGIKRRSKTTDILGATFEVAKLHLESKFLPGMSWENNSVYGWHIDHIIPIASAKTGSDVYKLMHYTNLQPLWAADNRSKSDKLNYKLPDYYR